MGGMPSGTSGERRATFLYGWAAMALTVGAVNFINVITILHERPQIGLAGPVIWEGSSWVTFNLFVFIPWLVLGRAPLDGRPRWLVVLAHVLAAVAFSFCHVAGFVALREFAYWIAGARYQFGAFGPHFLYELGKDVFGYVLAIAAFSIAALIVERRAPPELGEHSYAIRDGTRVLRVPLGEIVAIGSAGNYVEFVLRDGRKPLMRSPLSAVESELRAHGFLRVHRSWLVNPARMTALTPDGSGDYTIELGQTQVPLSRRFPEALAKLRA